MVSWNRSTVDDTPLVQGARITDQLAADHDPLDEPATSGAVLHVTELVIGRIRAARWLMRATGLLADLMIVARGTDAEDRASA